VFSIWARNGINFLLELTQGAFEQYPIAKENL
jgi:hypothetical protein